MDATARLVTAVISGSAVKEGTNAISAVRSAAAASGAESTWLGNTEEEKARINSWMEADLNNEKILLADLEKALESSSFIALPSRETAADLLVYSVLSSKNLQGETLQKSNPNVSRWLNHMQNFVSRLTGNTQFIKFKTSGLRAVSQADIPAAPTPAKHEEKKDVKKDEKKDAKKAEAKPEQSAAASAKPADVAADAGKKEGKAKEARKEEKTGAPAAGGEEEPKKKKAAGAAPTAAAGDKKEAAGGEFLPLQLDVRVGKIVSARQFTDKLFIEDIDVGEGQPRTVCSGLVQFYSSADQIVGKDVLVVCNLKPRKMADAESNGMVLAASNSDKSVVKLVQVPAGSKPGDRVSYSDAPAIPTEFPEPNKVNKKKILESVMPGWGTDAEGRVTWTDKEKGTVHTMLINGQPCTGAEVKNGTVG